MPFIEVNNRPVSSMKTGEMLSFHHPTRRSFASHLLRLARPGSHRRGLRICVVEVENHRGLVPSCCVPVVEGMKVKTHSPRAVKARKTVV